MSACVKVALIDDDVHKMRNIHAFLREWWPEWEVVERQSFVSGEKEALDGAASLIILDMTMPTYDVRGTETGGRERRYAGEEILRRMTRRRRDTPVIVMTQFQHFGEGADLVTLDQLRERLQARYSSVFLGAIFYHASKLSWKAELVELVQKHNERICRNDGRDR